MRLRTARWNLQIHSDGLNPIQSRKRAGRNNDAQPKVIGHECNAFSGPRRIDGGVGESGLDNRKRGDNQAGGTLKRDTDE